MKTHILIPAASGLCLILAACSDNSPNGLFRQTISILNDIRDKESADLAAPELERLMSEIKQVMHSEPYKGQNMETLIEKNTREAFETQMQRIMHARAYGSKKLADIFRSK